MLHWWMKYIHKACQKFNSELQCIFCSKFPFPTVLYYIFFQSCREILSTEIFKDRNCDYHVINRYICSNLPPKCEYLKTSTDRNGGWWQYICKYMCTDSSHNIRHIKQHLKAKRQWKCAHILNSSGFDLFWGKRRI